MISLIIEDRRQGLEHKRKVELIKSRLRTKEIRLENIIEETTEVLRINGNSTGKSNE